MILPDGLYGIDQLRGVVRSDFKSESDLCNYIETHIVAFCRDILGIEHKYHIREKSLKTSLKGTGKRLDFYIESKCGKFIAVECKKPTHTVESSLGIGQCLMYKTLMLRLGVSVDRIILVSTTLDTLIPEIIKTNNLAIEYVVMDRVKSLILHG